MSPREFDLFVIGAGSGGVRAARVAANHGARVAIAEEFRVGGTCVIRGCVPKKLYVLASRFRDAFEDAAGFGWSVETPRFDWPRLVAAKEKEITRLEGLYAQNLEKAGVELIRQRAMVEDAETVRLANGEMARAKAILIATGGAPVMEPNIPGIELAISSNEIFDLPIFPKRLLVIGAGYIAVEFACVFARLGSETHMAYRGELPLRGFDLDLRTRLAEAMSQSGLALHPAAAPIALEKTSGGVRARFANGAEFEVDVVLAATGRLPATAGLGLERAGVRLRENGAVVVDAEARSNVPSIYAVGDVTDRINLTPVAIREGQTFADRLFGGRAATVNYDSVPSAVFSTPEIGTVGLTEEEAAARFREVAVFETSFRPMQATLSGRGARVYMKLLVESAGGRVVGAHIFGPEAAEMAQLVALALRMNATKADFDATMALHPTMAEELVTMRAPARLIRG
ncbi:MAG: glutathione-disulfide reductase [Methylocystis sp.]